MTPRRSPSSSPPTTRGTAIVPVLDRIFDAVELDVRGARRRRLRGGHHDPGARRRTPRRSRGSTALVNTYGRGPAQRDPLRHRPRPARRRRGDDGRRQRRPAPDRRPGPARRPRRRGRGGLALHARRPAGRRPAGQGPAVAHRRARRWAGSARVGTQDATNSFKAYSTEFIREVGIDSRSGFEIGLELTAKARRLRRPVAEISTIWLDRTVGESNFDLKAWIPKYLRWYRFAFGPRLTLDGGASGRVPPSPLATTPPSNPRNGSRNA